MTLDNFDELVASLPDPAVDKRPPERVLSAQEQAEVDKAKAEEPKKVSPRVYGQKGEQWQQARLNRALCTKFYKNTDLPMVLPDGREIRITNTVDYTGEAALTIPGCSLRSYTIQVEVKTFQGSFTWSDISKAQARVLDLARLSGEFPLIGLCEREGMTIIKGWIIPWRRPVDQYPLNSKELDLMAKLARRTGRGLSPTWTWGRASTFLSQKSDLWDDAGVTDWADIMYELHTRAKGNFKGKSFRQKDQDLWLMHRYRKIGGRWYPPAWLGNLTAQVIMEPTPVPF